MNLSSGTAYPEALRVHADAEQVAVAGAELFVTTATAAVRERNRFRVALSGGSTPRRTYELLATSAFRDRVDWERVDFFWGDERYVPANDRESNYRMVAEALLQHVAVPAGHVHRIPTELAPPATAASAYEETIWKNFGKSQAVPRFDLVYLGLGANGHTASLFPHSPALRETGALVFADHVTEVGMWRISMSARLLNHGRTVAFLVAGGDKARVLHDVMIGPRDPERLPAQLIAPRGELLWLADRAAAGLVSDGK